MKKKYLITYKSADGFEMFLDNVSVASFAHTKEKGLLFDGIDAARAVADILKRAGTEGATIKLQIKSESE